MISITQQAEEFLEALAEELEIPESRYEQAESRYKSLGDWFHRDESTLRDLGPSVYVQGSFGLGTAIRPITDEEEYDVDSVCVLEQLDTTTVSQAELKRMVGVEIHTYHRAEKMVKPVREGRRCWTLEYADGAQFHMDNVPAVPNAGAQRLMLELRGLDASWASTAIAITDSETANFDAVGSDWPRSNPKGYAEWFRLRMGDTFDRRRNQMVASMRSKGVAATVEDIPDYKVRTPLQSAIMILKRHRDSMFASNPDVKPISIIVTTLSAHSYQGEETIAKSLISILSRMEQFIESDGRRHIIRNPTDPLENFADKWEEYPERANAFFRWLAQARDDFSRVASLFSHQDMSDAVVERMGTSLAKRANERASVRSSSSKSSLLRPSTSAPVGAATPIAFPDKPRVPTKPKGFA